MNFQGVDHAGIGVADMDVAFDYWMHKLGFTEVFFDYTGPVPGLEEITKTKATKARIVMLGHKNTTRLGPGKVKLVQRLDTDQAPPYPAGIGYGEVGLAEVCLHTLHTEQIFRDLVDALRVRHGVSKTLLRLQLLGALNWTSVWYRQGGADTGQIARHLVRVLRTGTQVTVKRGVTAG